MPRNGYGRLASVIILLSSCGGNDSTTVAPSTTSPAGMSTTVPVITSAPSTTESTVPAGTSTTVPVITSAPTTTESTVPAAVDATAVSECLTEAGLVVTPGGMILSEVPGIGVNPAGESDPSGFPVVVFVFESEEQAFSERDFLQQTFSDAGEFVVAGSILVWLASATGEFRQQVLDCTVGLTS